MIQNIKFLHILTATLIIDMIFLFIFKVIDGIKEKVNKMGIDNVK